MASWRKEWLTEGLARKVLYDYPNLDNRNLPQSIGCVTSHEKDEAKKAFRRICFKDVRIEAVEPIKNNRKPSCIWKIYYQLKDPNVELDDDDSNSSNTPPSRLPEDQQSLSILYEDITATSEILGMKVVAKYHTQDRFHAVVEYTPEGCNCQFQDFDGATEEPRMWPDITEVEVNLSCMKLHNM